MKKSIVLLLLMAPILFAASLEVGSSQHAGPKPFSAVSTQSLRYMVIVDASEFSEAMVINSITFFPYAVDTEEVTLDNFCVNLGYCSSGYLAANFDSNYVNGLKYRVFERTSPYTFYNTDLTVYFDTPFFYEPANGNLLLEITWLGGEHEIFTFDSDTSGFTAVYGSYASQAGDLFREIPHLLINGEMALEQMTFAGLKATFRL